MEAQRSSFETQLNEKSSDILRLEANILSLNQEILALKEVITQKSDVEA